MNRLLAAARPATTPPGPPRVSHPEPWPVPPALAQRAMFGASDDPTHWVRLDRDSKLIMARQALGPSATNDAVARLADALDQLAWSEVAAMNGGVVVINSQPYQPGLVIRFMGKDNLPQVVPAAGLGRGTPAWQWLLLLAGIAAGTYALAHIAARRRRKGPRRAGARRAR